jgi:hypothetical protein
MKPEKGKMLISRCRNFSNIGASPGSDPFAAVPANKGCAVLRRWYEGAKNRRFVAEGISV